MSLVVAVRQVLDQVHAVMQYANNVDRHFISPKFSVVQFAMACRSRSAWSASRNRQDLLMVQIWSF
jgi:hypothetical protein